jgi:preprotein translocase subunit SecG
VSAGNVIVVVIGIIAVVAVVGWFLLRRNEPEDAASHGSPDGTGSTLYYGEVNVAQSPS